MQGSSLSSGFLFVEEEGILDKVGFIGLSSVSRAVPGQMEAITLEMRGNYRDQEVGDIQCNASW